MEPGRELDALVAEKVMGWTVSRDVPGYPTTDMKYLEPTDPVAHGLRTGKFPPYSTDIAAAWEVVARFTEAERIIGHAGGVDLLDKWLVRLQYNHTWMWDAQFDHCVDRNSVGSDTEEFFAQAATAPHAICLAALAAVGAAVPA